MKKPQHLTLRNSLLSIAGIGLGLMTTLHLQGQSPAAAVAPAATAPSAAVPGTAVPSAAPQTPAAKPASTPPTNLLPPSPAATAPSLSAPAASAPRTANKIPAKQPNFTGPGVVVVPHGLVTAFDDIRVPAREPGTLMSLVVKGGESVLEGDILGELDNRDALAKRKIAEGELSVATTQAESTAELEAAQKAAEVSKIEMDQNIQIRAKNPDAVSDLDMRRSRFQFDRALAQIKVAEVDRVVAQLTTVVKSTQVEAADNEIQRRRIAAPQKGVVVEVFKKVGEWVQPGEPILRLVRLDRVRVEGFVLADEATPSEVAGKPVEVTVHLSRGKTEVVRGVIDFVSPIVEGTGRSRQFRVWAEVENRLLEGHYVIQPGASADLRIDKTYVGTYGVPTTEAKPNSAAPSSAVPSSAAPGNAAGGAPAAPSNWKPVTAPGKPAPAPAKPAAPGTSAQATPPSEPAGKPIAATPSTTETTTLKPVVESPAGAPGIGGGAFAPAATGQIPGVKRDAVPAPTAPAAPTTPPPAAPIK